MPSGEQLSASETYTKMMANYNKAYAGTPFEPEIQLEEAMFRRIINKESWEDSTGKVWTPEDMRNYLKKSKVLGFPSPYYYFSDLGVDPATIKDDEPLPERRAKTNNLGA
jgi:hypothetical protein